MIVTTGLARLDRLLADPTIDEVLVNAGRDVWVERCGQLESVAPSLRAGEVEHAIERILAPLGLRADAVSPIVEARLRDGSRVHIVAGPVSLDGPSLAIRRFSSTAIELSGFAEPDVVAFLIEAVRRRANIVVSGATSAGKTTLLNALVAHCPANERLVTVEDAAELRLQTPNVARLEARRATADGLGEVTVRMLLRAALRLRPDRLVVGEVRGAEALDMLLALNTGHAGSLTTVHANSAADSIVRLATLALLNDAALPLLGAQNLVGRAIDLVVHVTRGTRGGRRVDHISEVDASGTAVRIVADHRGVAAAPNRAWSVM